MLNIKSLSANRVFIGNIATCEARTIQVNGCVEPICISKTIGKKTI